MLIKVYTYERHVVFIRPDGSIRYINRRDPMDRSKWLEQEQDYRSIVLRKRDVELGLATYHEVESSAL
jgi:hypothetical protein